MLSIFFKQFKMLGIRLYSIFTFIGFSKLSGFTCLIRLYCHSGEGRNPKDFQRIRVSGCRIKSGVKHPVMYNQISLHYLEDKNFQGYLHYCEIRSYSTIIILLLSVRINSDFHHGTMCAQARIRSGVECN